MCPISPVSYRVPALPPETEYDDRPAVSDLIDEHLSKIKAIQKLLKKDPLYNSTNHDDLWILRFYLSHKSVKVASKAALSTLQFRNKYKLDELHDICHSWPMPNKNKQKQKVSLSLELPPIPQQKFHDCWKDMNSFFAVIPNPNRAVIAYIQMSAMDQHQVMKTMDYESVLHQTIFYNEWLFQAHDDITRRTGRLTKHLKVVDLKGMTFRAIDRSFMKRDSKIKKQLQDFYPQLLHSVLFINAPCAAQSVWNMFSPLFPYRIVDKINVVAPKKRKQDLIYFEKFVSREDLPKRYGGNLSQWPPPTF